MMKIVAGMGSIDEYIAYVEAGADEIFCGYVPQYWREQFGAKTPLNRREVLYYNVQLGSHSELVILSDMVKEYGVPVTIALNALYYQPEEYETVLRIMEECLELEFTSFIIADMALLVYAGNHMTDENRKKLSIHVSGEMGEWNSLTVNELCKLRCNRVIFHRQNTIDDMRRIINQINPESDRVTDGLTDAFTYLSDKVGFEAFVLNEKCQFTGAFCNSLHCDEMVHACLLPYEVENENEPDIVCENAEHEKETFREAGCEDIACENAEYKDTESGNARHELQSIHEMTDRYIPGMSGCALCSLWKLRHAGVEYLKLVSRGNYIEETVQDIRYLKQAIDLLEQMGKHCEESEYRRRMKEAVFGVKKQCSQHCYYYE